MDAQSWTAIVIQTWILLTVWVVWYINIKRDIKLMKVDVAKIEWIDKYIHSLSDFFRDWNFQWIPDRLKSYSTSYWKNDNRKN